jgi:hypothetical protein
MEWMWTESMLSFLELRRYLPPGSSMTFGRHSSSPAANRNCLIELALAHPEFSWVCFIDADMTPPAETVLQLLEHNVDVVGALCFQRSYPFAPCVNPFSSEPRGLYEVAQIGAGCLLVRRRVLEAIPYPWFEHPVPGVGEDILFGRKIQKAGFKVHTDDKLVVGHVGVIPITREIAEACRPILAASDAALPPCAIAFTRLTGENIERMDQMLTTPNPG